MIPDIPSLVNTVQNLIPPKKVSYLPVIQDILSTISITPRNIPYLMVQLLIRKILVILNMTNTSLRNMCYLTVRRLMSKIPDILIMNFINQKSMFCPMVKRSE